MTEEETTKGRTPRGGSADIEKAVLLALLHSGEPMTKAAIARTIRLSHPTVAGTLKRLMDAKEVSESDKKWSAHGDAFHVIGISVKSYSTERAEGGGFDLSWEILGIVTDRSGKIVTDRDGKEVDLEWNPQRPLDGDTSYEHVLNQICIVVEYLRTRALEQGKPVGALGIDIGGHVDAKSGEVLYSPNLNWFNKPLATDLQEATGLPTTVENDVNAFALWETFSPARHSRFAVVLVSEAIGGAIIERRRLLHGSTGGAGEIGHIPVAGQTAVCQCRRIGCVQSVASYVAIRREAAREEGLVPEGTEHVIRWLVDEAEIGATKPRDILDNAAHALSHGIVALICLVEPDEILISSTAFASSPYFQSQLRGHVRDHLFPSLKTDNIQFISTDLHHGAAGAAWAAIIAEPRISAHKSLDSASS
jgi:predicted NBD/HSP70 family sugar kinase